MEDSKKNGQSFLDKFKGRTNKIDKSGLNNVLDPSNLPSPQSGKDPANHRRKLASVQHNKNEQTYEMQKVDLDKLIPSNPERHSLNPIVKRTTLAKINPNKLDYVPSLYQSPHMGTRKQIQSTNSERSNTVQRRVFGKYLKLDDEALKHLEYLQQMDRDRAKRRISSSTTDHP